MEQILIQLRNWGCDIDGVMKRFVNNENLYISFLPQVISDENFVNLGEALKTKKIQEAFACAHTLKGVFGNMGLTPLYTLTCEIVEILRANSLEGVFERYQRLMELKQVFEEIVKSCGI